MSRDEALRQRADKQAKFVRALGDAAFVLQREVERQDACEYRDWEALIHTVLREADLVALRR